MEVTGDCRSLGETNATDGSLSGRVCGRPSDGQALQPLGMALMPREGNCDFSISVKDC